MAVSFAIDNWMQEQAQRAVATGGVAGSDTYPSDIEGQGTGKKSVSSLNSSLLHWKPSIPDFANIDAAILLADGTFLCLQCTVDTVHGFNFKTFKSDFLDQIGETVRSAMKKIVIMFVIPDDNETSTFNAVQVPYNQANFCKNVVEQTGTEDSPKIHIVWPRKTELILDVTFDDASIQKMEEKRVLAAYNDSVMLETHSDFTYVSDYDEDLDGEFSFDKEMDPKDWDMENIKMEFRWMKVDPVKKGSSPFFDLP